MSRPTFEDKLKAIDLYLNKRNSYRETAKLMSATKSQASATTVAALSLKVV
ncbi:hypothetical protein [Priestia megaterium]|uniref:hypothetical protein n=1 Tax=Priestia megaterium TaxID=1404 RepID=UPI003879A751